ncbi:MAG: hypothetical protein A3E38_01340 [Candidatus Moranbacteria bacterium RIFCSPHIGHO2_12_FULL_54_9]|nr:MAG: hypothetical protein A2878_00500 [Candidatus Moranbacteria bacterium RIFCSPHIGHO2_01_FULL_54_31]OGI24885.1 MAG: hypothetical protein A3E38_01340 [Candidatus Moranbacteria bacterium RIFCSPHIGHO2_12_FULL_54_9]
MTPEEQAHRQTGIRSSQALLFSLQSDKSRLERKQNDILNDIRRMKTELGHLKASLEEQEAAARSLKREIELVDEELARTKKHMDTL